MQVVFAHDAPDKVVGIAQLSGKRCSITPGQPVRRISTYLIDDSLLILLGVACCSTRPEHIEQPLKPIAQKTTFPFADGNFGNAYMLGNTLKRHALETFQYDLGSFYKTLFAFSPVDDGERRVGKIHPHDAVPVTEVFFIA